MAVSVESSWRCHLVVRIAREEFRQRHELEALTVAINRADHAASLAGTGILALEQGQITVLCGIQDRVEILLVTFSIVR